MQFNLSPRVPSCRRHHFLCATLPGSPWVGLLFPLSSLACCGFVWLPASCLQPICMFASTFWSVSGLRQGAQIVLGLQRVKSWHQSGIRLVPEMWSFGVLTPFRVALHQIKKPMAHLCRESSLLLGLCDGLSLVQPLLGRCLIDAQD